MLCYLSVRPSVLFLLLLCVMANQYESFRPHIRFSITVQIACTPPTPLAPMTLFGHFVSVAFNSERKKTPLRSRRVWHNFDKGSVNGQNAS